jgi:hypothetical protein
VAMAVLILVRLGDYYLEGSCDSCSGILLPDNSQLQVIVEERQGSTGRYLSDAYLSLSS